MPLSVDSPMFYYSGQYATPEGRAALVAAGLLDGDAAMSEPLEPKTIEVGSGQPVTIDKMFGPMIFANLRITADPQRGWVIEREIIKTGQFIEWVTIPAQIDEEFAGIDPTA